MKTKPTNASAEKFLGSISDPVRREECLAVLRMMKEITGADLTLYITPGLHRYSALLKRLGKHKATSSCLHIKRLTDVDLEVLRELVSTAN